MLSNGYFLGKEREEIEMIVSPGQSPNPFTIVIALKFGGTLTIEPGSSLSLTLLQIYIYIYIYIYISILSFLIFYKVCSSNPSNIVQPKNITVFTSKFVFATTNNDNCGKDIRDKRSCLCVDKDEHKKRKRFNDVKKIIYNYDYEII